MFISLAYHRYKIFLGKQRNRRNSYGRTGSTMPAADIIEPKTDWLKQYDSEVTTAGTVETILADLKNGATSSTAEEGYDDE